MPPTYPHPSSNPRTITLDPSAPGTTIQYALAIESALNILFATYILILPGHFLSYLTPNNSTTSPSLTNPLSTTTTNPTLITPLATTLAQLLSTLIYTLTIPMLLAIPSTRRGIEMRAPVYTYLGLSEVMLIALFLYLAVGVGEEGSGMSRKACMVAVGNLVPPCAFRGYVLWVRPEWMGRYRDEDGDGDGDGNRNRGKKE